MMLTSSGLGDELVEAPRRELFDAMLSFGECSRQRQDEFHRHSWGDRTYLSVCMRRTDAATTSYTVVETWLGGASLRYHAGAPDELFLEREHVPV